MLRRKFIRAKFGVCITIDRHGRQIPSILSGISPNHRFAVAVAGRIEGRREDPALQFLATCRAQVKKASITSDKRRCLLPAAVVTIITKNGDRLNFAPHVEAVVLRAMPATIRRSAITVPDFIMITTAALDTRIPLFSF
jgi:hypothetical protein